MQFNFKKNYHHIPNALTIFRMILIIPIIVIFLLDNNFGIIYKYTIENLTFNIHYNQIIIVILFMVASFSDFLDGYLSRKYHWESNFGKFWDPLADKILINSIFILLAYRNLTFMVFPIIFIIRDSVVDGIRMWSSSQNIVVAANNFGKWKTTAQMLAIIIVLFIGTSNTTITWWYWGIQNLWIYIATLLSIVSGLVYVKDFLFLLKKNKKTPKKLTKK